ncbi:DUF481 domain-containing protein [Allosphingosinicella indica]|uniref:Putative salt-induced outer membrane protein n=1 Tax=Allosphingosinicella indica TaxID=941907 RepID=A0A1X7GIA0_9SPHN|nr:DUF481 domain-containing protein [Allosphingosinicella indica]SMF70227.1 putative salt-induced outer membrane protein [Allosphingosinicella indica]
MFPPLLMMLSTGTEPLPWIAPPPPYPVEIALAPPPVAIAAPPPTFLTRQVRAMIDTALKKKDTQAVETILALAKTTNPNATPELDAIGNAFRAGVAAEKAAAEQARREALLAASPLEYWKGSVELGGSRSTGNNDILGLYGAVNLERTGLDWRHKLNGRADFQRNNGVTTAERFLASYQPNYRLDPRLYAYGLAQYEHDPFLGFDNRYTLGAGMGYSVIAKPNIKLDLEGGPTLRLTDPVLEPSTTTVAGRASLDFAWKVSPTLQLKQVGAIYVEGGDSSATSTTSLDAALIGNLKARLSYNVQYEAGPPPGTKSVDTVSRATLVYSF